MADIAVPILRVADASRAAAWYERLGYVTEWEHRFEPSLPAFVSVARPGGARLFLSEHEGDARPGALVYLGLADAGEVDALARAAGGEVVDQPWAREAWVTDPDGNRLRIGGPRA